MPCQEVDTNTSKQRSGGCGTQTAGIHCAGTQNPGNNKTNETAHYDGSSWTDGGNFPINIAYHTMGGTQTAAVIAGGDSPGITSAGQEWNFSAFETKQVTTS